MTENQFKEMWCVVYNNNNNVLHNFDCLEHSLINGSQLAELKKYIPHMSLLLNL